MPMPIYSISNLRSFIFGLTPFGWLPSITLNSLFLMEIFLIYTIFDFGTGVYENGVLLHEEEGGVNAEGSEPTGNLVSSATCITFRRHLEQTPALKPAILVFLFIPGG
jgi:hypothetical protein